MLKITVQISEHRWIGNFGKPGHLYVTNFNLEPVNTWSYWVVNEYP